MRPVRIYARTYVHPVPYRNGSHWVPVRTVRVPDHLWDAAKRVASDRGETLTSVIINALERYVRAHPLDPDEY